MQLDSRVYVAGHRGLVGSALLRHLRARGFSKLIARTHEELDLENQTSVMRFFAEERPEYVLLAAAKVGGIMANNTFPADFIRSNLAVQLNVLEAAYRFDVKKLLFLGSSCIYPKHAPQPIKEEYLLSGELEPTNRPYAIAKIAGLELCRSYNRQFGTNYVSVMPTNLYGPGDNFDLQNSHVLPALLRKFHEAKTSGSPSVTVWGTGRARREFLHVDDLAAACTFVMERYDSSEIVNIGFGEDLTIAQLAQLIAEVVGYDGEIVFDTSKPDGTPQKLLDISKLTGLGWRPTIGLQQGLRDTYAWYVRAVADAAEPAPAERVAAR
ncbi:MAG TPA: GDP-L-fucose synthase [Gemmatimonadaceae bacterium]|nr:GDP-L-fucose synthase [Gemmatimonadaceae bacterium]